MKYSGDLSKAGVFIKSLTQKIESLLFIDDSTSNDSLKNQALEISTSLQKAEDDMYLWMDNFGKAMNDVKNEEEKLKLYKELNTEIKNITTLTDESIAKLSLIHI